MIEFLTSTDALVLYALGIVIALLGYIDEFTGSEGITALIIAIVWPVWIPVMFLRSARKKGWL